MAEMLLKSLGGYAAAPGDSEKGIGVIRTTLGKPVFRRRPELLTAGRDLAVFAG